MIVSDNTPTFQSRTMGKTLRQEGTYTLRVFQGPRESVCAQRPIYNPWTRLRDLFRPKSKALEAPRSICLQEYIRIFDQALQCFLVLRVTQI